MLTKTLLAADYYAHGRTIVRHGPIRRWELLSLRQSEKLEPLLPILSDSSSACSSSPLAPYARADSNAEIHSVASTATTSLDEAVCQLLSPSGPWRLGFKLRIPDCSSTVHPTNRSPTALITVAHIFKFVMRVSSARNVDSKGTPKLFEITVEIPINILSVSQTNFPISRMDLKDFFWFSASARQSSFIFLRMKEIIVRRPRSWILRNELGRPSLPVW